MAGFTDIFSDEITFDTKTSRKLPIDRNSWDNAILSFFEESIQLPPDIGGVEIEYINQTDDDAASIGKVVVEYNDKKIAFPFLIKNNKVSPFDVFITENKTYPADTSYLEKLFTSYSMGEPIKREERKKLRTGPTVGGVFIGSSMPEVMAMVDQAKLGSYFKDNPKIANIYKTTSKGKLLEDVLKKVASYKAQKPPDSILSAVATPLSMGSCKVGMLKESGYTERTVTMGEAEKVFPSEVAALVKKALSTNTVANMQSPEPMRGNTQATVGEISPVTISGPLNKKGNMVDWNGDKLNYSMTLANNLKRLQIGEISTFRQVVFKNPNKDEYTPPFYIKVKVTIDGQLMLKGNDSFKRKVHVIIDPKMKDVFLDDDNPIIALIPADWHIIHLPASEKKHGHETYVAKVSFYQPKTELFVDYIPTLNKYTIAGASDKSHNGNGFSWEKTATVLNYYVGNRFKEAYQTSKTFEYVAPTTTKVASVKFNTDPKFIKLAALIPDDEPAAQLLGMNYITPQVIEDANAFIPKMNEVIEYLAELLLSARITEALPEEEIKRAISYIIKVKEAIQTAAFEYLYDDIM